MGNVFKVDEVQSVACVAQYILPGNIIVEISRIFAKSFVQLLYAILKTISTVE